MTTKNEKERQRVAQDKAQSILAQLLRDDDNKYCVDCDAKGPRWASWNLGVFLCIRCAGIHRNLGVHISRVKSINLDAWTPEQVARVVQMGNSKARAVYEGQLPDGFRRPQTDAALETFIRAKYEHKKYLAKEWVEPPPPAPAFDIDEEMRKEREAKKGHRGGSSASANSAGSGVGLGGSSGNKSNGGVSSVTDTYPNAVPRPVSTQPASTTIDADRVPQSPTPSGGRAAGGGRTPVDGREGSIGSGGTPSAAGSTSKSPSADLLGLGLGLVDTSDPFKSPPADPSKGSDKDAESEFFNQKAPEEKKFLTKESILSLYSTISSASSSNPFPGQANPSVDAASLFSASVGGGGGAGVQSLAGLNFGPLPTGIPNGVASTATVTPFGPVHIPAAVSTPFGAVPNPLAAATTADIAAAPSPFAMIDPLNSLNASNQQSQQHSFANFSAFNTTNNNNNHSSDAQSLFNPISAATSVATSTNPFLSSGNQLSQPMSSLTFGGQPTIDTITSTPLPTLSATSLFSSPIPAQQQQSVPSQSASLFPSIFTTPGTLNNSMTTTTTTNATGTPSSGVGKINGIGSINPFLSDANSTPPPPPAAVLSSGFPVPPFGAGTTKPSVATDLFANFAAFTATPSAGPGPGQPATAAAGTVTTGSSTAAGNAAAQDFAAFWS